MSACWEISFMKNQRSLWLLSTMVASLLLAGAAFAGQDIPTNRAAIDLAKREAELGGNAANVAGREAETSELPTLPRENAQAGPSAGEPPAGHLFDFPGTWTPRGDTQLTQFDLPEHLSLGFGMQYRVMYNASDIPGPGGSSFQDTSPYDFFRQRLRLNLGVAPKGVPAGGVVQVEFRGGFGGSSPAVSDPRGAEPTLNPFNRLQSRGIRYGYLFAEPFEHQRFIVGILPVSDEFGDVLFSADWDFNVGGVALLGSHGPDSYRLGYLRLVDGVGALDANLVSEKGSLVIGDYMHPFKHASVGAHVYYLDIGKGLPLGATRELWVGSVVKAQIRGLSFRGFAILNSGELGIGSLDANGHVVSGYQTSESHNGYAVKLEGTRSFDTVETSLQALFSSGDSNGDVAHRFVTLQGLLGTQGYWGYTHIFTANGPSDVNDLAVELGNGGAGLSTLQGRLRAPIADRLSGEVSAGWFQARQPRNGSQNMGSELGGMLTFRVAKAFNLDAGLARAFVGEFFGAGAKDLYEVFARAQFQF